MDHKKPSEIETSFPHCILKDGYFDSILNRIERMKAKTASRQKITGSEKQHTPEVSLLQSNHTLILEIERWEAKTSIY